MENPEIDAMDEFGGISAGRENVIQNLSHEPFDYIIRSVETSAPPPRTRTSQNTHTVQSLQQRRSKIWQSVLRRKKRVLLSRGRGRRNPTPTTNNS